MKTPISFFGLLTGIVFLIITGCASGTQKDFIQDGKVLIESGNWSDAYRALEDGLGSSDSKIRLAVYDLITSHPELKLAASRSFEIVSLEKTFKTFDPISAKAIEIARLRWYEKFATDKDFNIALANIEAAYNKASGLRAMELTERRKIGDGLIVDENTFNQLEIDEREKIKQLNPMMQVIPTANIGKIISQQILDKSKPGSNYGSQLGSAVGQSVYIDQAFSQRSYSAVGQLSAGLIGAVVGASLNKSAESKFLINYGIQLNDGSIRAVLMTSTDGVSSPIGQCVFTANIEDAPSYLCSDNIVKFLERLKNTKLSDGVPGDKLENKIICKIDPIGSLKLTRDKCTQLNGMEIN